ncbi:MAG: DUF4190 domain-containing protein [Bacteroidota bacterium]
MNYSRCLLFLLIFVQLTSCSKRYGGLKKIRVAHVSQQPVNHKLSKHVLTGDSRKTALADHKIPESASVSAIPDIIYSDTNSYLQSKHSGIHTELNTEITRESLAIKPLPADSMEQQSVERKWNKSTLVSAGTVLLGVLVGFILWSNPIALVYVSAGFGVLAFAYARKGWKEIKVNKEKGKGIALVAMILGTIAMCTLFAIIPAFLFSFSARTGQSFYNTWLVITGLFSAMVLYGELHVKKVKPKENAIPEASQKPKVEPGPQNRNVTAVIAFVCALIFFAVAGAIALSLLPAFIWGALLLVTPIVALILGIIALLAIRKTHQKGKWMAWVAILAVPLLLLAMVLVMSPILGLLALIGGGIYLMIKK